MTPQRLSVTFFPSYSQFLICDVKTPFDPDMIPHFNAPDEVAAVGGKSLSIRTREVSVALLKDTDVEIVVQTAATRLPAPEGAWDVTAQAQISIPSGVLGICDIISNADQPELTLAVDATLLDLDVFGRLVDDAQYFVVHLAPSGK